MTREEMEEIVAEHESKAAKVRALHAAGAKTQAISDFLGIRYQHTYNVLLRAGLVGKKDEDAFPFDPDAEIVAARVADDGSINLPAALLDRYNITPGQPLFCRAGPDGLTILGRDAALAHVRQAMREKMPAEAALLDMLLPSRSPDGDQGP